MSVHKSSCTTLHDVQVMQDHAPSCSHARSCIVMHRHASSCRSCIFVVMSSSKRRAVQDEDIDEDDDFGGGDSEVARNGNDEAENDDDVADGKETDAIEQVDNVRTIHFPCFVDLPLFQAAQVNPSNETDDAKSLRVSARANKGKWMQVAINRQLDANFQRKRVHANVCDELN